MLVNMRSATHQEDAAHSDHAPSHNSFSCDNWTNSAASAFYRQLSALMKEKDCSSVGYHTHTSLIHSRVTFGLLRVDITCLRGNRSPFPWHMGFEDASPDVPVAE
eukprot:scpid112038/ scgid26300/ 